MVIPGNANVVIRRFAQAALIVATFAGFPTAAHAGRFIPTLGPGDIIPPIPMIAQDGRRFTFSDLRGRAVLVSFIYTRCTDARMCPLVTAKFARIASTVGALPIRLVILTLDPERDTPAVLRRYGRAFGADPRVLTLATGSKTATEELAGRFGIAYAPSAAGTIVHTEAAVVIAPDGRIAQTVFGNTWSPDDLLAAARSTVSEPASPVGVLRLWWNAALERCGGGPALQAGTVIGILVLALAATSGVFWSAFGDVRSARGRARVKKTGP